MNPLSPLFSHLFSLEDTGLGKKGGQYCGRTKSFFGAIPYFLVIADYEKSFLYVGLK